VFVNHLSEAKGEQDGEASGNLRNMSLADSCFDFLSSLAKRRAGPRALVRAFIESVGLYASHPPPFGYPKEVTDKLVELANAYLTSGQAKDLQALRVAARTTQRYYDSPFDQGKGNARYPPKN
jgi:hypothetical protein